MPILGSKSALTSSKMYVWGWNRSMLSAKLPRTTYFNFSQINKELTNLNLKVVLFNKLDQLNIDTDILLIDSYGETSKFYNIAKYVFLGKSLIKSLIEDSGQNPIEPARQGCKIFHGPNVSNFSEIYEYLKTLGITKKINNSVIIQLVFRYIIFIWIFFFWL